MIICSPQNKLAQENVGIR